MADKFTKEQRSYCMSKIRSNKTMPELMLRRELKFHGFSYQPKNAVGNPDFINWENKTVIFIDGCFWHKCPIHYKEPASNKEYWVPKIERNVIRGKEIDIAYQNSGWKVIRIWGHELK